MEIKPITLAILAISLAGMSAHANEWNLRDLRHARRIVHFDARVQPIDSVWYQPPRAPGWHEEAGN
jgi:hypothetical protein